MNEEDTRRKKPTKKKISKCRFVTLNTYRCILGICVENSRKNGRNPIHEFCEILMDTDTRGKVEGVGDPK